MLQCFADVVTAMVFPKCVVFNVEETYEVMRREMSGVFFFYLVKIQLCC